MVDDGKRKKTADREISMDDFAELVKTELEKVSGKDYRIAVNKVMKNNDVSLCGLSIIKEDVQVAPCIYLETYHKRYREGEKIDNILKSIIDTYEEHKDDIRMDMSYFRDFGCVCTHLRGKLINTEKNVEWLEEMPHREFLDLSLVYYVEVPFECANGTIQVMNSHMELWNVTEEELFAHFKDNMDTGEKPVLKHMGELLKEMESEANMLVPDRNFPLYVLTNGKRMNGAVEMMRKEILAQAAERLGKDLMILPSSVHEILLLPEDGEKDQAQKLADMVAEVNVTQLSEEEILSFHVYRYDRKSKEVAIVA